MTNNRSSLVVNLDPALSSPSSRSSRSSGSSRCMVPASYAHSGTRAVRPVGKRRVVQPAPALRSGVSRSGVSRSGVAPSGVTQSRSLRSLRNRFAVPLLALIVLLLAALLLIGTGSSGARANGESPQQTYTVMAGDTLWSVARSIQPTGDVRPLVSKIARANHVGQSIVPGTQLLLP
jgi:LysM repeat protein